jgi:trehalose 6-phosphate synthase
MSRLIVVSNRVPVPDQGGPAAGGLAVGVLSALEQIGGIWFGCDGRVTGDSQTHGPDIVKHGNIIYATIALNQRDHDGYYNGFSNNILWPLFHYLLGYYHYDHEQYEAYERVNAEFAAKLVPLLEPDDIIWVHDYHLIPLAEKLREQGAEQPIGFFLHVPFPAFDMLRVLPVMRRMLEHLTKYDLVGFQTRNNLSSFNDCMVQALGAELDADGTLRLAGQELHAGVFPIGVDVDAIEESAASITHYDYANRLLASLTGRNLIIGADRLDYSKGIPERLRSYQRLLERCPRYAGRIVYMQISAPSRTDIRGYQEIKREVDELLGGITGHFSDFDWVPIRYIEQPFERDILMSFFRVARIGLATALRDGMNLVAKEFIAAQNSEDPGMLVVSQLAGAADELTDAIVVNPYDPDAVAAGIENGLEMPLLERKERHHAMLDVLRKNDVHAWYRRFLEALRDVGH